MKLLLVTPYFYPKIGGLENYAKGMASSLMHMYNWEIVVITSNHIEKKLQIEDIDGIKVYRLPRLFKISNTPINPLWYFSIKKIIKNEKPDIINAHTPVPFIAEMAALANKRLPFFLTYHAYTLYKHTTSSFNILIKVYTYLQTFLFKKADKIILVTEAIKTTIPQKYRNKSIVINNSVLQKSIPPLRKHVLTEPKLVFIGSLDKTHEWKGLNKILESLKIYIDKHGSKISLSIIGDGNDAINYKQKVKQLGLEKHVTFHGRVEGKEKKKIIEESSLGIIYPISSNDAFPTVLLEYWQYSLPVLVANSAPLNLLVKNNHNAILVEPSNTEALADAINKTMQDSFLQEKLKINGYEELLKKYVMESEMKKFYHLSKNI